MLFTEWDWDTALAVRYEEGMEEGLEKGITQTKEETARNALALGLSVEETHAITGLGMEAINRLKQEQ